MNNNQMVMEKSRALRSAAVSGFQRSLARERTNLRDPPSSNHAPDKPAAVVIVLRRRGNAANAERMSGMSTKADKEGSIAVYPSGTPARPNGQLLIWNAWRCCGAAPTGRWTTCRSFAQWLTTGAALTHRKRIYATGLSNGGMLSYRPAARPATCSQPSLP